MNDCPRTPAPDAPLLADAKRAVAMPYARRGWPVLPLHTIRDGHCTCGKANCKSPGKHPRTQHGLKEATADQETIDRWWTRWPDANVGILTGAASCIVALDVDPRNGGDDSLATLEHEHGELPETIEALTGGGGRHLLFAHPGGYVKSRNVAPGIDVKADGGYIVVEPSLHLSGRAYAWELSHHPEDTELAALPDWLLKLMRGQPKATPPVTDNGGAVSAAEIIRAGQRNTVLASIAGTMRRRGLLEPEIRAALLEVNRSRCRPPLDEQEVSGIAASIARYAVGTDLQLSEQGSTDKHIVERSGPIPLAAHFTEQGNAERMIARHGELLRFCDLWGKWLIWDGSRWRIDDVRRIEALGVDTIKSIYAEAAAESDQRRRQSIADWARRSETGHHLRQMIELARHRVPVVPGDLDADPWLLNVSNGTIDLHTGELREHRRGDLITKVAPVVSDRNAKCPTFRRFLNETTCGRGDMATYLQQSLGMCLTGDISEQILPVWWGSGSNGKSTLIDPILYIMGEYAGRAAPELLVAKKWSAHPTEIADLFGKRLVVASETEKGQRLRVQFVKAITGDATLKGRHMRQDFFEFKRTHKTILVTNNRPDVDEQTHAIWRRLQLVPFTNIVADDQQDKRLPKKLLAEAPGILAWMVRGCLDWQDRGLIVPSDVRAATKQYRAECDHIAQFFDECVTLTPGAWTASGRLGECFDRWCRENAVEPNHRELKQRLRQEHCEPKPARQGRGWSGVGIVTDLAEVPD